MSALTCVDTNVLVRRFVIDDVEQNRLALQLFDTFDENNQAYITNIVLVEFFWLLQRGYGMPRETLTYYLNNLLDCNDIAFESSLAAYAALQSFNAGADFADAMIAALAAEAGCATTVTFGKKAAKQLGMKLLA
jgi:predicted nucleic-acid-binding protein